MPQNDLTQQVFNTICERLAEGRSLRSICRDEDIPVRESSVREALLRSPERASQYAKARDIGVDAMVDEMLDICHDGSNDWMMVERKRGMEIVLDKEHVMRSKLRKEAIQWYVSKLAPKKYSDRIVQDVTSSDGSLKGLSRDQIAHKLNAILEAAQKRAEAAKQQTEEDLDALVESLV